MYVKRNSLITNNEIINVKSKKKKQIKSITTITDNACNSPLTYLMKADKKPEIKNMRTSDLMVNFIYLIKFVSQMIRKYKNIM